MAKNLTTIYGEMTFPAKSAIRALRISGDKVEKVIKKLFISGKDVFKNPRKAIVGTLLNHKGQKIDTITLIYYKKPNSYTGEDVAEFFCHGSSAVISSLTKSFELLGLKKAKNGEFSFRAFLNGKLSLKEAKRLKALMEVDTSVGATLTFSSEEKLQNEIENFRKRLISLISKWESSIDFLEDFFPNDNGKLLKEIEDLKIRVFTLLNMAKRGESLKEGFKVAIFGLPNSGKSSLFNNILGKEKAIVTPHPGTTRDILEEKVEIDGFPVIFYDMAGARKKSAKIEQKGIERAIETAKSSDLVLFLFDGRKGFTKKDEIFFKIINKKEIVLVATKKDLYKNEKYKNGFIEISNKTLFGIDNLLKKITYFAKRKYLRKETIFLDNRSSDLLTNIHSLMDESSRFFKEGNEIASLDILKRVLYKLDEINNFNSMEEVYDTIFKEFCIGK